MNTLEHDEWTAAMNDWTFAWRDAREAGDDPELRALHIARAMIAWDRVRDIHTRSLARQFPVLRDD